LKSDCLSSGSLVRSLVPQSDSSLRKFLAALTLLLTLAVPAPSSARGGTHVRLFDPNLKLLLERGSVQSPTLRALIREVEATPILVFAECAVRLPSGVGARLNFVTTVRDVRYVRVGVDCSLTQRWQIALLAHEMQHALEVGQHPDVVDVEDMESLYEDIGFRTPRDGTLRHFESNAAIAVQRAVDHELGGHVERQSNTD